MHPRWGEVVHVCVVAPCDLHDHDDLDDDNDIDGNDDGLK